MLQTETIDKVLFELFSKEGREKWIRFRTNGRAGETDLPGILLENGFAIRFTCNPKTKEFTSIEIKTREEGVKEIIELEQAIRKYNAESMGVPTSIEEYNQKSLKERSYWVYRWLADIEEPETTGKRIEGSPQFIPFPFLGYAIKFRMDERSRIVEAEAIDIDQAEDQAQSYVLALEGSKGENKN